MRLWRFFICGVVGAGANSTWAPSASLDTAQSEAYSYAQFYSYSFNETAQFEVLLFYSYSYSFGETAAPSARSRAC
jgi:hypothetical protein